MKKLVFLFVMVACSLVSSGQVKKNAKPADNLNDTYCTGIFKTSDGTIFNVVDNPSAQSYNNILDWLVGRIAGYQVRHTRSNVSIPVMRGEVAGIFIDEMPATASAVDHLPISDIAIIKVIRGPFVGNSGNSSGAILIYTVREEEGG